MDTRLLLAEVTACLAFFGLCLRFSCGLLVRLFDFSKKLLEMTCTVVVCAGVVMELDPCSNEFSLGWFTGMVR